MTRATVWWAAIGGALALTSRLMGEYLWIMSFLPLLAWAVVGLVLLAVALWKLRTAATRPSALRTAGTVIGVALLFLPTTSLGSWVTERVRFMRAREAYDRAVAQAGAEGTNASAGLREGKGGLGYIVDPGPPVRVAFPWPGGIMDNWCGAVFDPTGEVMKVNDLPLWSETWRQSSVTKLFAGDMTSCRRLDQAYFLCCFT